MTGQIIASLFDGFINCLFNGFNVALLVFGCLLLLKALRRVNRDRAELARFIRQFGELGDKPGKPEIKNGIPLEEYEEGGLVRKTVEALFHLSATSTEDRDKLYYLEAIRNEGRTAIPKAVPGLSVIVGFLGTVVGLLLAIFPLKEILEQDDILLGTEGMKLLTENMSGAMGGMSTAFGTTLVGLTVAFLLSMGNIWFQIRWNKLEEELTDFLYVRLYPAFATPADENIVLLLTDSVLAIQKTMEAIRHTNSQMVQSIGTLSGDMAQYHQDNTKLIHGITRAVSEFIQSQQENKALMQSVQTIATQATRSFDRIENLLDQAKDDRHGFLAYLQDSRHEIGEISKLQHKAYEASNKNLLEQLNTLYDGIATHFTKTFDSHIQAFENLKMQMKEELETEYKSKIGELLKQTTSLEKSLEAQVKTANEVYTKKVEQMERLLQQFQQGVSEDRQNTMTETKKLLKELAALVNQTHEANRRLLVEYQ